MLEDAVERLELGAIRAALLERARTPLGALEVKALAPFAKSDEAKARIEAIRQARILLSEDEAPPVGGAEDVRAPLSLGEKGVMLEGPALRAIAETMRSGSYVRTHLLGWEAKAPLLYGMAASLPDLSRLADEVSKSFDPDGRLADDASPDLGTLRKRVRSLEEMIRTQITELLEASNIKPYLQETYFTVRADRYVLPIRASFKNEVKGIVHDASGSGQTVFIEPSAVVDLGNRLKIAQSEQVEEEHRILSDLTMRVAEHAGEIREMMRVIGLVDLITSCGRLAHDLGCTPIIPEDKPGFDLIDARHPLLVLQAKLAAPETPMRVIGNDLGLKPEQRILLLTGPNTGGKTVAMKTIGLFALMVRCGLHLPCSERSRIGWFERIEVAIGDQQSIAAHLSTFAAHMKMLIETIGAASEKSLVLIDEIVADTDPMQGQALAQAILEDLANKGAHIVVTTHFERLKAVPFADLRFRNAGVGFDPERLRPTYKVTLDVPQSSSGVDIAQGLGLPGGIIKRARSLIGEGSQALEVLMRELQTRSGDLEAEKRKAEAARREAVEERHRLIEIERRLERDRQELKREAQQDLLKDIEATRAEVRKIISALQNASETLSARDAMRIANDASATIAKVEETQKEKLRAMGGDEPRDGEPLGEVKIGDWVHVRHIGKDGDVVGVDGKEAVIAVGNMRMRVPTNGLYPAKTKRSQKPQQRADSGRLKKELHDAKTARPVGGPKVTEEIDLRGHTIDESLDRLDAFLDHHYGTPTTHVKVVHGHGTGMLRNAVRAHLKVSGYVRSMRPGDEHEGGDGATIVELA